MYCVEVSMYEVLQLKNDKGDVSANLLLSLKKICLPCVIAVVASLLCWITCPCLSATLLVLLLLRSTLPDGLQIALMELCFRL